jgi:hypothetical protein
MQHDSRPDSWAGNLSHDIEQSERDRLSDDQLLGLLAALRSGESTALKQLLQGLRWLVYEQVTDAELVGPAFAELGEALECLAKPECDCDRADAQKLMKYLRNAVRRSYSTYRREVSTNLLAPASTKASRKARAKKRGLEPEPIHEPKRDWSHSTDYVGGKKSIDGGGSTWLDREANPSVPSSMRGDMTTAAIEMAEHVARTPFEQDVLDRRLEGMSIRDIAHDLGVTKYQVETVLELFKQRASEVL